MSSDFDSAGAGGIIEIPAANAQQSFSRKSPSVRYFFMGSLEPQATSIRGVTMSVQCIEHGCAG